MTEAERQAMCEHGLQYFEENFKREMLLVRLDGWLRELGKRVHQ